MDCLLPTRAQRGQAIKKDVCVAQRVAEVEGVGKRGSVEIDLRVSFDERPEILAFLPRTKRTPLYEPVRLVAVVPGGDERAENTLAEHEAVGGVEIRAHALR